MRNALRMRPERIIIGECRGAETLDMLQAMNTGHDGSMTTLHANTPRDAMARLETMIMMAGFELPLKAMRQQIASAVDLIIQANRLQGGPRKITHITEVMGMEQDMIIMQDIFRYKQDGIDENGRAFGQFEATGVRPTFMDRLEAAGVRLPASAFRERVMLRATRSVDAPSTHACMTLIDLSSSAFRRRGRPGRRRGRCCLRGDRTAQVEDRLDVLDRHEARRSRQSSPMQASLLAQPLDDGAKRHRAAVSSSSATCRLLFEQADARLTPSTLLRDHPAGWRWPACAVPVVDGLYRGAGPGRWPLCFGILPLVWLMMRRKRRLKTFAAQLPDALELVARALRAGHSLAAGMHVVAEEMPAPIGNEFGRVFEEQNLGIPLEEALRNMSERVPNLDLQFFVTAVVLQRQTGGDLAEILDKIGYVIRERFKIWGQVQALTGEGRLSGIVLLALPPAAVPGRVPHEARLRDGAVHATRWA